MSQTPITDASNLDERLSEYRELLSQFEAVRGRLRRAEEERGTVPRRVYEKVRAEYDRELDTLRARMTPLREALDGFRNQYEQTLRDANGALEAVEEELAELTFRHRIGEYSDDAATARRQDIEARMADARSRIDGVRDTLVALGAPEPDAPAADTAEAAPAAPSEPVRAPEPPRAAEPAPEPVAPPAPVRATEPEPQPAAPPAAAPDPGAAARRPVLKPAAADAPRAGFENPHDWIDEFGRDLKKNPAPPARPASRPDPAPAAPMSPPSLVFVSGPHAGQSIPLLATTLTIGREHDNNIEIKDADVARYHARILNDRGEYVVEDMASTTGTWVNGERTQRAALGHGDVIRIGQTEIAVDFEWASNSLERASIDPSA